MKWYGAVLILLIGLTCLSFCGATPQQTINNLPIPEVSSASATSSSLTAATEVPKTQPDAWAQARAQLPADVPVYKSTWIPQRFGPPALEEARVDATEGPMYTVTYPSQDELLVFILNIGKGALGNEPPSKELETEHITILGVEGTLTVTHDTDKMLVNWKKQGNNYQIKAFTKHMTSEEMKRVIASLVPVK